MLDESHNDQISQRPHSEPSIETVAELAGNQSLPPNATTQSSADNQEETIRELENEIRAGERWLIGIGIATVIINTVIALIYYGQLGEMRKSTDAATRAANTAEQTLREIQKGGTDTHDLAVAAGKQADAAGKQATASDQIAQRALIQAKATNALAEETHRSTGIAERNLELQQQPWVGIKAINVKSDIVPDTDIKMSVVVENSGTGPAVKTTVRTMASWNCNPFPSNPVLNFNGPVTPTLLLRGVQTESGDITIRIPQPQFGLYENAIRECKVRAYGTIEYCDVLGRSHFRHYCGVWNPKTKRDFLLCPTYNDGDQDYSDSKPMACKQ